MIYFHVSTKLASHDPKEGSITIIMPSANNKRVLWRATTQGEWQEKTFDNGRSLGFDLKQHLKWAMTHDGEKLAVAIRTQKNSNEITINGEHAYSVPFDTIYQMEWISGSLCWTAWNDEEIRRPREEGAPTRIHTFVNGEDLTGQFDFEPMWRGHHAHQVYVADNRNSRSYFEYDDGTVVEMGRAMKYRDRPWSEREESNVPKITRDKVANTCSATWRGVTGPSFDEIESHGGMDMFTFNDDKSRVAYAGKNGSRIRNAVERFLSKYEDTIESSKVLSMLVLWPYALLFNPHFGPLHAYDKMSERHVVVDHGNKVWEKRYRFTDIRFFTPAGKLVVVVSERNGQRLAIDEHEGPLFDAIENPRIMPGENSLSYIGLRGNDFYRVVVGL